ncbi:MAG: transcriptional regulator NrdR [Phycisphaerae bacterium]|nr:transcriptional regulator NrdR [Phycisphaerae bacterium]
MRCPFCGEDKDKVIDSRSSEQGKVIRRRRECLGCERRFTTYERVEELVKLNVVKRDGTRVPYNRQQLLGGLEKACYKRPVSAAQILEIAEEVEDRLFRTYEREVESHEVGRLVARQLKAVDQVAYVRFASVYKHFRDLEDLLDEVKDVMESAQAADRPNQGKLF